MIFDWLFSPWVLGPSILFGLWFGLGVAYEEWRKRDNRSK